MQGLGVTWIDEEVYRQVQRSEYLTSRWGRPSVG